ncbi:Uncharacterised protein [uncultured archaeon]|nr:Uncharacterised protein [uncultured archaeon]
MGILDYIKESLSTSVQRFLKQLEEELCRNIEIRINKIKRQIIKELIAILIIFISILFLVLSAVFFLIEYVHLGKSVSFLIMGIMFLIIGIIVKLV